MTKMVTIHPGLWQREVRKYGFESSQLSRKKIADYLGWGHLYILTHPQVRPDWKAGYEQIGFERDELVSVSHYQSDIGHNNLLSYTVTFATHLSALVCQKDLLI